MITHAEPRGAFQLFDVLPTGLMLLDASGGILRANQLAAQHLERDGPEMLGRDLFRDVLPQLDREGLGERYREQMATGEVALDWESRLPSPRGEVHLGFSARSFTFEHASWGILLVEDRSSAGQEAERRRRAERPAAVGELATGVAHEINNPLASIKSFAQLLAREARTEEQTQALEVIIQESGRIARAVENLLTFSRQQAATGREPVNLSEVAARVLELQGHALETAGIQVRRDLDEGISPVVGDAGALQQVVLNLIVNAEQALAERPRDRMLLVRTRESSEGVLLSVVDNGPGISRDLLPHLFDPYRTPVPRGAGMGLGIAATIVREHGGQIMAESEEGRGAAFFVRLPRAGTSVGAVAPAAPPQEPGQHPRRTLRVLVADDESTLRLAIAMFLGRRGHQVTQAADAHEAFRLAQEKEFDVALVDARMPGDGLRLLEQLESIPALRGRTALMTGDLGRARTTQGVTTGRPYLTKPFDMLEAVNLVEQLGQ